MSLNNKIRGLREIWQFENRLALIVIKILFPREKLNVYRYKGLEILTDQVGGDANGAREVLTSPMYRRFFPKMTLERPINVLDFGANNGGFPLLLAAEDIELGKIVSVELNPNTFVRLNFNLNRNLTCEVIALNAALCGENKKLRVSLGAGSVSDSIFSERTDENPQVSEIDGHTLDYFIETYFGDRQIDILKIDVEGAEFEVFLKPSHSRISQCRYLIMEIHERNGRLAEEIVPIVENLGFERQPLDPSADPSVHFFINSALG